MKLHFDLATVLQGDYGALFLHGVELTLAMAGLAWCLSLVVGILLTLIRLTNRRAAIMFVSTFVAYHRNVPTLRYCSGTSASRPCCLCPCKTG